MSQVDLAERNRRLAAARHAPRPKHAVRRALLRVLAAWPRLPRPPRPNPDHVLFIRPDHVGDALLSTPAILAFKQARPHARISVLCGAWAAEVYAAYPEIDQVLTLPFPGFVRGKKTGGWFGPYGLAFRSAGWLRQLGAGVAVLLRPDHWWGGLLAARAGIPVRVGYATPDLAPFLTERRPYTPAHAVQEGIGLIESLTGPISAAVRLTFPVHPADSAYVDSLLDPALRGGPLVVIHPGAGSPYKTWAAGNWAQVADVLVERAAARIVFTGSDREHAPILTALGLMRHASAAQSLAGETNLAQLAALYARAVLVMGPDTGPLHLAVAVGTPTIHLYGPADPARFGPYGDPQKHVVIGSEMACRPCGILDWTGDDPANHPCIRDIATARVLAAALRAVRG